MLRAMRATPAVVGTCGQCGGPVVAAPGLHERGAACERGCTVLPAAFFAKALEMKPPCLL